MTKQSVERRFDIIFLVLFFLLVMGIPLVFTSLTRSVFEVNKMLLLRTVTIVTLCVWLFKYLLFKDNGLDNDSADSVSILGFKWKKIGGLAKSDKIMKTGILIGCHELINDNHINYLYKKLYEFFIYSK